MELHAKILLCIPIQALDFGGTLHVSKALPSLLIKQTFSHQHRRIDQQFIRVIYCSEKIVVALAQMVWRLWPLTKQKLLIIFCFCSFTKHALHPLFQNSILNHYILKLRCSRLRGERKELKWNGCITYIQGWRNKRLFR